MSSLNKGKYEAFFIDIDYFCARPTIESCSRKEPNGTVVFLGFDYGAEVYRLGKAFDESDLSRRDFLSKMKEYKEKYGDVFYRDRLAYIPDADLEMLSVLLTTIMRSERFGDGCIAEAVSDGSIAAILLRLRELTKVG